ncbi:MAG TPA: thiamine phosphate synthase [Vicinamibacteria bacterium]|nr:thiamine phosphate synthase [Vicinamibacteria bacterium]
MVTDGGGPGAPVDALVARVAAAARAGVDLVQVREKTLSDRALLAVVSAVCAALASTSTRLLVNGRPDVALAAGAYGVQVPEEGLPVAEVKRAFPSLTVGASCHSVEAARRAAGEGADFVLLGPIFATPGKEERTLGLDVLAAAAAAVAVPLHAIGGVTPARVPALRAAGAQGGAAIRPFREGPADAIIRAFREAEGGRPFPT